jgi:putative aldouronate transport system permease protein
VGTDVWKNFGYNTVVYLAAITGLDEDLFEAAKIDGANRMKQILFVTLPGIAPIIMLMLILNLGNVLNAGFEQVFNLYNPLVYQTADIIDTFVYRISLVQANYSLGTAVGLLKSVVSFILILISYKLANKYSDYSIF